MFTRALRRSFGIINKPGAQTARAGIFASSSPILGVQSRWHSVQPLEQETSEFINLDLFSMSSELPEEFALLSTPVPTAESINPETGEKYNKTQLKKALKKRQTLEKKLVKWRARQADQQEKQAAALEKAKSIVLTLDESLPEATALKLHDVTPAVAGKRVRVQAWAHSVRKQGGLMFLQLRDGTERELLQTVLSGDMAHCYDAVTMHREATVEVYGSVAEDERAPGGVELRADYWRLIGASHADIEQEAPRTKTGKANDHVRLDKRHIVVREQETQRILQARCMVTRHFRQHFFDKNFYEVCPPTMVQTMCEGGSELFDFSFYGEKAYLTQSSQLYLETVIPSLGNVFCLAQSYRAEMSRTRRHLSEYAHLEAEMPFIDFEDLLNYVEDMMVDTCQRIWDDEKLRELVLSLNPEFKVPERPFVRMDYADAVAYCNEHGIWNDNPDDIGEGAEPRPYENGEDIKEKQEREMIQRIGKPVLLCRFPYHMKAFYMKKCPENEYYTESVDLLVPGVGEIVGGSMREDNYEVLVNGFESHGMPPEKYNWYLDQRKYGSQPHGGFGLGLERFLTWVLGRDTIRDVVLYPRFIGRCTP